MFIELQKQWLSFRNRDPRLLRPAASASYILAIGSGQRILYRLGSGLWLVPVLVLRRSRFLNDIAETVRVRNESENQLCDPVTAKGTGPQDHRARLHFTMLNREQS